MSYLSKNDLLTGDGNPIFQKGDTIKGRVGSGGPGLPVIRLEVNTKTSDTHTAPEVTIKEGQLDHPLAGLGREPFGVGTKGRLHVMGSFGHELATIQAQRGGVTGPATFITNACVVGKNCPATAAGGRRHSRRVTKRSRTTRRRLRNTRRTYRKKSKGGKRATARSRNVSRKRRI